MNGRPRTLRSGSCACLLLGASLICSQASAAVFNANWTGGGDGVSYNDPLNWDIGVVPIDTLVDTYVVNIPASKSVTFDVPTVGNTVYQLTLGSGATLTVNPGRDLAVTDSANIAGLLTTSNGTFTASSAASQLSGTASRIIASGGATVVVNAASYTNTSLASGDLISATDPGTMLDLSSILTINNDKDSNGSPITSIAARNGATLDLSGLTNVVGARYGDTLRFEVATGGTLDLSSLNSITGSRDVRFTTDGTALNLPALQTISAGVLFEYTNGMTIDLPSLTSVDGAGQSYTTELAPPDSGALNMPSLTTMQRTTLSVGAGQTLTTGSLSDIDGSRIFISGGHVFNGVTAATYDTLDYFSGGDFFTAEGAGSVLNLSSLTSLDFNQDKGGSPVYTIAARDGGVVDLSGLTNIIGGLYGDTLQFSVTNGGSIPLTNLASITGSRNVRFTSDGTAFALPSLATIESAVTFELATGQSLDLPSLINFDGTGSSYESTFKAPASGSISANNLTQMDDVDISIEVGGTVNLPSLNSFTQGTLTLGAGQTLNIGSLGNIDGSRIYVSGGVVFNAVTATSYDSSDFYGGSDFFTATGTGSVLNLSTLTSMNFDQDKGGSPIYAIAARDNGHVDLSGVTNIVGGRYGDSVRLEVMTGGTLDISNLQSITGNRNVRFTSDGTALNLPELQTIDSAVFFELAAGQTLDLPALTTINGQGSSLTGELAPPDSGTINAPNLVSVTRTMVTVEAGQTLTTGSLATIDGSRFHISGGETFTSVTATSYDSLDYFGEGDVFSATGTGTLLDMSSIKSIDFDQDSSGSPIFAIAARDGGELDLSGLETVIGGRYGDSVRFEASTGGTLDISNLESVTGYRNVRFTSDGTTLNLPKLTTIEGGYVFELAAGQTLDLPSLVSADGAGSSFTSTLAAPDGGTINAPNLDTIKRTQISLGANQTLNLGTLANIDGSWINLNGGQSLSITASSYDALGHYSTGDFFSATGTGTRLDLSSIQTMDFYQDLGGSPVYTIAARDYGELDLSGLVSVAGARSTDYLEFTAQTYGTLDLSSLTTETNNTRFVANTGGTIKFGSLVNIDANLSATDLDSTLDVAGSLKLGPNSTLSVSNSAELHIGEDFSFEQTTESYVVLDAGVVRMDGTGGQLLEVGGEDLSVTGSSAGNFGIGQLVIGQTTQRTSVDLIDAIDNGNRGSSGTEALYLYGLGGPDGLRILNDSALILNGINVYAYDALTSSMVHLNSLFGVGELRIAYDDGYLQLVPLDFQWSNNLGGDFNVSSNWSDGFVPLGSDSAIWNLGSAVGYTVQFGTNVATDSAVIKIDTVTYDLGGFTYTNAAQNATTAIVVGQDATDNADLTVINGTLAGPSARIASTAGSVGRLNVSADGVLDVDELSFGLGDGIVVVDTDGIVVVDRLDMGTVGKFNVTDGAALVGSGSTAGLAAGSYNQTDGALAVTFDTIPVTTDPAVTATGAANLGGTLALTVDDALVLSAGDSFQIISAASVVGGFDEVTLPSLTGLGLDVQYGVDNVTIAAGLLGDLDHDGFVGLGDLDIVLNQWNMSVNAGSWTQGDASGDGFVGLDDLDVVLAYWNTGTPPQVAVPEPTGVALLGLGGLALLRRRHAS